ncbi:WcaI family glycosyltransferase [Nonlabens agnitus]|uniref:Glycosyltransferase WbuB n=1 Tax=Nonlabens agnitus TaxID=870484 RepID=A0A2S9WWE1_9FLAO|nr:WcaI family glycosyltransferase [Nonlabens agnitus]PRP67783.1 glycosyltransferase WbuB [Nonlabens agnitus]
MIEGKTITFIGLNYAPEDTAIGLYSTQMVDALVAAGAYVNVVTAMPYYPQWKIQKPYDTAENYLAEKNETINVYRYKQYVPATPTFLKRVFHILSFTYGSWRNLQKIKKTDLVISIIPFTTSAYLGGRHAHKHQVPHWIHIQDFEFDAALQSGVSGGSKKQVFKQLFKIEKSILDKASTVSTISHLMIKKLQSKTKTSTYYLPNWIDPDSFQIDDSRENHTYLQSKKFKLLYSGNVGDKQDWEFFLAFAKAIPSQHFEIIIVGAGSRMQWLKENVQLDNVHYHDPVPYADLPWLLSSADAHFLFQKEDVIDTVMPSKLLGMMASGKPSLVLGNAASEVRNVLEDSSGGVYTSDYTVEGAVATLLNWKEHPDVPHQVGMQARSYVKKHFSRSQILDQWIDQLASLVP